MTAGGGRERGSSFRLAKWSLDPSWDTFLNFDAQLTKQSLYAPAVDDNGVREGDITVEVCLISVSRAQEEEAPKAASSSSANSAPHDPLGAAPFP